MKTLKVLAVTVFAAISIYSSEASAAPVAAATSTESVLNNAGNFMQPRHRVIRRRVVRRNVHFQRAHRPYVNRRVVVRHRVYHNRPIHRRY